MPTTHTPLTTRSGTVPTVTYKNGRTSERALRSNDDIVRYFVDSLLETSARPYRKVNSMIVERDKIFSYGNHFCVAQILRRKSGVPYMVLLNGDSWTPSRWISTADHQAQVKSMCEIVREQVGFKFFTVPFSAVEAAGIDRTSIRPLEIRPDRNETLHRSSATPPGEFVPIFGERDPADPWKPAPIIGRETTKCVAPREMHAYPNGNAELQSDGTWTWTLSRHWLGDSVFRGKSKETRVRRMTDDEQALWDAANEFRRMAKEMNELHRQSFVPGEGYAAWMHEAYRDLVNHANDIQAQLPHGASAVGVSFTIERWASYLSSFDYGEPHRPYFLCELPYGCKAETVDEAFDALMPDIVRLHIGLGDAVLRQGDIFAIPTKFTTDELESEARATTVTRFVKLLDVHPWGEYAKADVKIRRYKASETYEAGELDIHGTNHRATHAIVTKDGRWFGRGRLVHAPNGRDPDHRVVKLEKDVWYEFVKNTVPTSKVPGRAPRFIGNARVDQSGQSRAWMLGGNVD